VGTDRYWHQTVSGVDCHFDNPPAQPTATSEASRLVSETEHNLEDQGQSNPCTTLDRPWEFQEVQTPRFQDNRHKKVVNLTHRPPLPHMKYSWYSHLLLAELTPWPKAVGGIMSMKNSNGTRELPVCSAVPQLTEPPRAAEYRGLWVNSWPALRVNTCVLGWRLGCQKI